MGYCAAMSDIIFNSVSTESWTIDDLVACLNEVSYDGDWITSDDAKVEYIRRYLGHSYFTVEEALKRFDEIMAEKQNADA